MVLLRTDVSTFLSPRRILLKLHLDLFKIDRRMVYEYPPEPLNDFELYVLALEDRRFFQHRGVDFRSCVRELWRALTRRRFGGASTIDMQFVRTATGFRDRTIRRKLYEMLLAWLIQYRYTKFQILRSYLACAFYGSRIFGVERAARRIYGEDAAGITSDQAAELAAMLVYPKPLTPSDDWWLRVRRRASYAKRLQPGLKKRLKKLPIPELFQI
jgi:membrane peptidoglycan carboxypeptidase